MARVKIETNEEIAGRIITLHERIAFIESAPNRSSTSPEARRIQRAIVDTYRTELHMMAMRENLNLALHIIQKPMPKGNGI